MNKTSASNKPGFRRRLGKAVGHLLGRGSQKRADTPQLIPQLKPEHKPQPDPSDEKAAVSVPQRTALVAPVRTAEKSYKNLMACRESEALSTISSSNAKTPVARIVYPGRTGARVYENPAIFSSGSLPRGIYGAAPAVPGSGCSSGQRSQQNSTAQHSQSSQQSTQSRSRQNSQQSGAHTPSGSSGYSSMHTRQYSDGGASLGHGNDNSQWLLYSNPATYCSAASLPRPIFKPVPSVAIAEHSSVPRSGQNSAEQYGQRSTAGRLRQNTQLSGSGSSGYGSMQSSMHTRQNSEGPDSGRDNDTAPGQVYDNRGVFWSAPLSPVYEHSSTSCSLEGSVEQGSPLWI